MIMALSVSLLAPQAWADTQSSNSYKFEEATIDAGSLVESNSASFRGTSAVGDIGNGEGASTNFQSVLGSRSTPDPTLSFIVNQANGAFTDFSPTQAATATTNFSVINYTTYGYVVQIFGSSLANGSHAIPAMGSTGPSQIGQEQFGINLVANTLPSSLGSNPVQDIFGQGIADTNYSTPNQYRFVNGETIASAPQNSGKTTFTISYIVNVSSLTPGGQYTGDQTVVVTGTY